MAATEDSPWRRGATPRLLAALAAIVVIGGLGDTISPVLVVHAPLLLVALNPRARNVLLATRTVAVGPLLAVSLLRRMALVPVLYRLGRIHGTASLEWIDRRFPRTGSWTRRVERWFDRAAVPVVLLLPGGVTAYLAGSTGMHEGLLLLLSALGILGRLVVLLVAGDALAVPLTWLLHWIAAHQGALLAASVVIGTVQMARLGRRLRRPAPPAVELIGRATGPEEAAPVPVSVAPPVDEEGG